MATEKTAEELELELLFEQKFGHVEIELAMLNAETFIEKGGWIFKSHVYSTKELLDSPRIQKIHSIIEKIGDDVRNWSINGNLTPAGFDVYRRKRNKINRQLKNIRNAIIKRKPHKWEIIASVFDGATKIIMRLLPTVANLLKLGLKLVVDDSDSIKLLTKH